MFWERLVQREYPLLCEQYIESVREYPGTEKMEIISNVFYEAHF